MLNRLSQRLGSQCICGVTGASMLLGLAAAAPLSAFAELGPKPSAPAVTAGATVTAPAKILARVDLLAGAPVIQSGAETGALKAGQFIGPDSTLHVPEGARVRVSFPNGDALHLGERTVLALRGDANGWRAQMWEGALTVYAAPAAKGHGQIETALGDLEAGEGKLSVLMPPSGSSISIFAFNNWRAWESREKDAAYRLDSASQDWQVKARWRATGQDAVALSAGYMFVQDAAGLAKTRLDPKVEVELTHLTSPEGIVLRTALEALKDDDLPRAQQNLTQLQRAFPNNGHAAFYLGQIALDNNQNGEAARQWQRYIQIDPKGAAEKGIPQRVTLLLHDEMRSEVEKALQQEATLSKAPPEPGTVAILPFVNRGDEAQSVLSKGLTAMIVSDLSKIPGLRILERAKLQRLSDEIALSQSGVVDEKSALRAGRILRAEKLMIGDYTVQDTDK